MSLEQFTRDGGPFARRYEYDGETVFVADFGREETETSVDLVDGTVIVVAGDEQYDLDLPDGVNDAHTFMKNGVLTVELEAEQ